MSRLRIQHRRSAWIGDAPTITGPAFNWDRIDFVVIHYPGHGGVPDGDPGENANDLPGFIRRSQEAAVRTRGYSYYYGILVDWLGGTWEVRGDTFQNAANAPSAFNQRSIAIQAMIDVGDTTTEYADAAIADLVAQIRAIRPNVKVIPHQDGVKHFANATATACCGSPLIAKVRSGLFEQPITPPNDDEEFDVDTKQKIDALYDAFIGKGIDNPGAPISETNPSLVGRLRSASDAVILALWPEHPKTATRGKGWAIRALENLITAVKAQRPSNG